MSKYVTYYAISEEIKEHVATHFTWPVGECVDGTVYLCLDRVKDAVDPVYNCPLCYDSLDLFFGDYPDLEGKRDTDKVDEDGNVIKEYIINRMSVC